MKNAINLFFMTSAMVACLLFYSESISAQEPDTTPSPVADEFETYDLAIKLLGVAESREDAWLAIAAARLLNEIPGGVLLPENTSESAGNAAEFSKLDEESVREVSRRSTNKALELASRLAGDDERLKGEIAKISSAQSSWYSYTCHTYNDLDVWFYWTAANARAARGQSMRLCRANTPYGYYCYHSHCN